jgi:acyl carrier protein
VADLAAEVLAELRRVARDELDLDAPIDRASTLEGGMRLDSVGLIVVAVALENRFRVRLHEEDAGELATVGDLVALVCRRVDEQRAPRGTA